MVGHGGDVNKCASTGYESALGYARSFGFHDLAKELQELAKSKEK